MSGAAAQKGKARSGSFLRRRSALLATALMSGTAAAVTEWIYASSQGAPGPLWLLVSLLGLWLLAALSLFLIQSTGFFLAVGGGDATVRQRMRDGLSRWRADAGSEIDHVRSGRMLAFFLSFAVFWGLAAIHIRFLVIKAHDATLIGLASASLVVLDLLVACLFWVILSRMIAKLVARTGGLVTVVRLLVALLVVGVGVIAAVLTFTWQTVILVGGQSLLLPLAALGLQLILWLAPKRRLSVPIWSFLPALLVTVALITVGFSRPPVRSGLPEYGLTSRYLHAGLLKLSDFDGDRFASPPFGRDCGPFDPDINPTQRENPGNGIDENCDGLDELLTVAIFPEHGSQITVTERPNLILVTVDSLRADHLGFMGYERDTTPQLDPIAEQAAVFTRAYSQDSGTGPSFWSLMNGKTPFQVALSDTAPFPPSIGEDETTLAEHLSAAGYTTHAVLCGYVFNDRHWNIRRGFEHYLEVCGRRTDLLAEDTADRAIARLAEAREGEGPFLMWVHFYDPHHDYTDHPGTDFGSDTMATYDEEIRYTQEHLARFVDEARQDTDRDTYIAISADHGENFNEHGRAPHARNLYVNVTHVPLLVLGPDVTPSRIDSPVALNDVFPTFLELAGVSIPAETTHGSLVGAFTGEPVDQNRYVFQENSYSRPRRDVKAVVWDRYHLLLDLTQDSVELYDIVADPGETENLVGRGLEVESQLLEVLQAFLQTTNTPDEL